MVQVTVLRCAILPSLMPNWEIAIKDFTHSGGYYDLKNRIHLVTQPTLILWGNQDEMLGTAAAVKFQQAISNSQLTWLPVVGHTPHYERPEAVAKYIMGFLNLPSLSREGFPYRLLTRLSR